MLSGSYLIQYAYNIINMTLGKENEAESGAGEITAADLDLLGNGKSRYQKEPDVVRRAIVKAIRRGRVWGPDDGDTLGKSDVFKKSPFEEAD